MVGKYNRFLLGLCLFLGAFAVSCKEGFPGYIRCVEVGFAVIMTGIACWSHMMPGSHLLLQVETERRIISGSGMLSVCV